MPEKGRSYKIKLCTRPTELSSLNSSVFSLFLYTRMNRHHIGCPKKTFFCPQKSPQKLFELFTQGFLVVDLWFQLSFSVEYSISKGCLLLLTRPQLSKSMTWLHTLTRLQLLIFDAAFDVDGMTSVADVTTVVSYISEKTYLSCVAWYATLPVIVWVGRSLLFCIRATHAISPILKIDSLDLWIQKNKKGKEKGEKKRQKDMGICF